MGQVKQRLKYSSILEGGVDMPSKIEWTDSADQWLSGVWRITILRPCQNTGGLFFPIGKPPIGTCTYATESCLQHCHALVDKHNGYDEETRIPESEKWRIYSWVMSHSADQVASQFMSDLEGLQTPVLHWFASGDCPPGDETHIIAIMGLLPAWIGQVAYTRSRPLWVRNKNIITLTVESEDEMTEPGRYAIPDYKTEITYIKRPDRKIRAGVCAPYYTHADPEEGLPEHYLSCRACWRYNSGCFDRRMED